MIKAVFCDVDNTLTSPQTRLIIPRALEAIHKARQNGIRVFAATGRHTRTLEEGKLLHGIALDGYVAVNGQLCYLPDDTIIHKIVLDPQEVSLILSISREMNFACCMAETDRLYLTGMDENVRAFHEMLHIPFPEMASTEGAENRDVLAITAYVGNEMDALIASRLTRSASVRFNPFNCDIIPREGGKAVGMQAMLDYFSLSAGEALTIGDGQNDVSMLQAAGVGVAIGECGADVLAAADYHAPAPDDDGIWHTFEKFGLI